MKKNQGITLIALIITVVIMLILAGVAISNLVSNDGLFSKVKSGAQEYNEKIEAEKSEYQDILDMLSNIDVTYELQGWGGAKFLSVTREGSSVEIVESPTVVSFSEYKAMATTALNGKSNADKENMFVNGERLFHSENYAEESEITLEVILNSYGYTNITELIEGEGYESLDEFLIYKLYVLSGNIIPNCGLSKEMLDAKSEEEKDQLFIDGIRLTPGISQAFKTFEESDPLNAEKTNRTLILEFFSVADEVIYSSINEIVGYSYSQYLVDNGYNRDFLQIADNEACVVCYNSNINKISATEFGFYIWGEHKPTFIVKVGNEIKEKTFIMRAIEI